MKQQLRIMISGGGTGGHIFPAISIADEIKRRYPDAEILFVGAEQRMEMTRVPEAGYKIVGLPVVGFNRSNLFKNISVLNKLLVSLFKVNKIINKFRPDVVIGVGGYVSGPLLKIAAKKSIPTLIQEQNSYAGLTNKLLAKNVSKICVAYEGLEKIFPKSKLVLTGNPYRKELLTEISKSEAYANFDLDPNKKTILVLGGSLGSRTLNQSILRKMDLLTDSDIQILWQCGKHYHNDIVIDLMNRENANKIHLYDFIDRMDLAYNVADLVVSRAGASSISELSLLKKPTILIPSPNVAEDHQTKNAMALVDKDAAIMISDNDAVEKLLDIAIATVNNIDLLNKLSTNITKMAYPDATEKIVDEVEAIIQKKKECT